MTKEEIKKMIEDLQKEIEQQRQSQEFFKTKKEGYGCWCQLEGEIYAKQTMIYELRKYLYKEV